MFGYTILYVALIAFLLVLDCGVGKAGIQSWPSQIC